jgi:N6-L-threonylcarbamoyladenine synthase
MRIFALPRPMLHSGDLHFSLSGLKTAVLTRVKKRKPLDETTKKMIALEFENAVTDVLVAKVTPSNV